MVVFLLFCGLHNEAGDSKFRNRRQYIAYVGHVGAKIISLVLSLKKVLAYPKDSFITRIEIRAFRPIFGRNQGKWQMSRSLGSSSLGGPRIVELSIMLTHKRYWLRGELPTFRIFPPLPERRRRREERSTKSLSPQPRSRLDRPALERENPSGQGPLTIWTY